MKRYWVSAFLGGLVLVCTLLAQSTNRRAAQPANGKGSMTNKVIKTDEEWKAQVRENQGLLLSIDGIQIKPKISPALTRCSVELDQEETLATSV